MKERGSKRVKKPWPTKDAMEQIYEKNLWGGEGSDFYSGLGSHHPEFTAPYIRTVRSFLSSFENPPVVCDLGCGDFNIGKELVEHTAKYIGVDIVEELIDRNKEQFGAAKVAFHCLDLAKEPLPTGDCAILRNVLQHLSNEEIQAIIKKLNAYTYLLLTEHVPEGEFTPNKDIISGQGIRLKKKSGVRLTAPPFNMIVKEEKQLLSIPYKEGGGRVVTTLYRLQ